MTDPGFLPIALSILSFGLSCFMAGVTTGKWLQKREEANK